MRDYGKISTSIWNSRKFQGLQSDDARLAYLYLHTCPSVNSIGCFVLKDGYAADDLGWDKERYQRAIEALSVALLIGFHRPENLIRIVDFLVHDPFTNKNHAAGAIKLANALPECDEKYYLFNDIAQQKFIENIPLQNRAIEGLSNGYRTPEPEPEPEPKTVANATDGVAVDFTKAIFENGVKFLVDHGTAEKQARAIVGKWRKDCPDKDIFDAFAECNRAGVVEPIAWITARLHPPPPVDMAALMAGINPDGTLKQ